MSGRTVEERGQGKGVSMLRRVGWMAYMSLTLEAKDQKARQAFGHGPLMKLPGPPGGVSQPNDHVAEGLGACDDSTCSPAYVQVKRCARAVSRPRWSGVQRWGGAWGGVGGGEGERMRVERVLERVRNTAPS